MILGNISLLDCFAFVLFLLPQLLLHVNIFKLLYCGLQLVPFFLVSLPYGFISERFFTSRLRRPPFVQHATAFQDLVIRCVRYAFKNFPAEIGAVFFSKAVSLPFLRFRMLRHGIVNPPLSWREVNVGGVAGIWVTSDEDVDPDIVIYYLHGGGFSMGSPYFYLEFLIAYMNLLRPYYNNPAVFALDYTLVPYASHPTQLQQTIRGYDYVLSRTYKRASRICVAGDSAGATLVLSLLLHLAEQIEYCALRPGYATLISPWVTLVSDRNRDTKSDYLNANSLHLYGSQYAGKAENLSRPLVSPGLCTDPRAWARAAPTHGFYFAFGSEEVLGPEVRVLLRRLRDGKVNVVSREDPGGIHAWVVARLFLEDTKSERLKGIAEMVDAVRGAIKPTGLIGKVAQGIERGKVKTGEVKDGLWGRYII